MSDHLWLTNWLTRVGIELLGQLKTALFLRDGFPKEKEEKKKEEEKEDKREEKDEGRPSNGVQYEITYVGTAQQVGVAQQLVKKVRAGDFTGISIFGTGTLSWQKNIFWPNNDIIKCSKDQRQLSDTCDRKRPYSVLTNS